MSEPYQFGTGPVATGQSPVKSQYPLDFAAVPLLGNAGKKINDYVYNDLLSPVVTDRPPGKNAAAGNVGAGIVFAVRNPRSLFTKIIKAGVGETGGSGDELLPHQLPDGRILTEEEWARHVGGVAPVQMPPMWLADP